jgi:hypothetical protein
VSRGGAIAKNVTANHPTASNAIVDHLYGAASGVLKQWRVL